MRFYIWGTGTVADRVYTNKMNGKLEGFIETRTNKTSYRDFPVYSADKVIEQDYDYIIVANQFADEIYNLCVKRNADLSKIIFFEKGKYTEFNTCPEVRTMLGEKNYTIYAGNYGRLENTFFEKDAQKYEEMNKREAFCIQEKFLYPIISDKYAANTGFDDYFWMDLWAAKHIISNGIKEHYDIGSRVDGFIAHLLAAGVKVNMIDIRPLRGKVENLYAVVDDATTLKQFEDNSIQSLSALCSPEHFGLGRYGDPIDPEACFKFFDKLQRKLKPGGSAYLAVPIGQDRVEFNAHRVFYADTVIACLNELELAEFSVTEKGSFFYQEDIHKYDDREQGYVTGLFYFKKPLEAGGIVA